MDEIENITSEFEPRKRDSVVSEKLLQHAAEALRKLDLKECARIATWAEENPTQDCAPALCLLLQRPPGIRARRAWNRADWVDLRIRSIQALRKIPEYHATRPLTNTLLNDLPAVQAESALALCDAGADAVPAIAAAIGSVTDWRFDGMIATIDTLARLQEKAAGPTLARMLFGMVPQPPSRWTRLQLKWGFGIGGLLAAWGCLETWPTFRFDAFPSILEIASGTILFLSFSAISTMCVGVFIRRGKTVEAARLHKAASNALIAIQDPKSVPSLVEVATENYPSSGRSGAIRALAQILPALGPEDFGLLTGEVERRLTGMSASHNSELTMAIVKCLEFVGTGQSVGPVERLSRRKSLERTVAGDIRAEAERVLPVLIERKRLEEASSVLLRPSQVEPNTAAVLLRPAAGYAGREEPAEQLLRPGGAD